MQITPYPEIEKLLSRLLHQIQRILDKNFIGLYLYGSLVTGDFDPEISDIDLLAVTSFDIDDQEFEQLRNMHNALMIENPEWEGRIEVQYIAVNALQTFKTQKSQIAVISPGEPFNVKDAGIDWLINWYIVREHGKVLLGPNPQTVIPPISKEEFIQSSREHARYWAEWANQPRDQRGQSYAILTMCRVLYASQWGEQASKSQAALWTQEQFPQWASLIQKALVWRKASNDELVGHEATFPETARFIHFVADQIVCV
jgi:predicted nucleotidyltransferase